MADSTRGLRKPPRLEALEDRSLLSITPLGVVSDAPTDSVRVALVADTESAEMKVESPVDDGAVFDTVGGDEAGWGVYKGDAVSDDSDPNLFIYDDLPPDASFRTLIVEDGVPEGGDLPPDEAELIFWTGVVTDDTDPGLVAVDDQPPEAPVRTLTGDEGVTDEIVVQPTIFHDLNPDASWLEPVTDGGSDGATKDGDPAPWTDDSGRDLSGEVDPPILYTMTGDEGVTAAPVEDGESVVPEEWMAYSVQTVAPPAEAPPAAETADTGKHAVILPAQARTTVADAPKAARARDFEGAPVEQTNGVTGYRGRRLGTENAPA